MRQPGTDAIIIQTNRIEASDKSTPAQVTVCFDGACPLCAAATNHYRSQDGSDQLSFVDVPEPDVSRGAEPDAEVAMRRFHVRLADGTLVFGAHALAVLWHTLPGWHRAACITRISGATPARKLGDRLFLPIRSFLSKRAFWSGTETALAHKAAC